MKNEYMAESYKDKSELPKKVRIDACSNCQLNCVKCYAREDSDGLKKGSKIGFLKFENYKKFIDENIIEEVELSNHGEMFLNPELEEIIRYSYEKNVALTAYNGVNLNYLPRYGRGTC